MNWDYPLFLWLNFDGGALLDSLMVIISGKLTWLPLYFGLLYLVWRKGGWRGLLYFASAIIIAISLSDIVAGVFKHTGILKNLWPSFPVRLRPMHTPELEGVIHAICGGGKNGTISAHGATTASVALLGGLALRRRWLNVVLVVWVLLVSYSRIYLAYHFPQDILLGWLTGVVCGSVAYIIYRSFSKK